MLKSRNFVGLSFVAIIALFFIVLLPQAYGTEKLSIDKPAVEGLTGMNKININTATIEELTQLKGIGEEYAKRIIEYRENHGLFKKPEDIMEIKGIGEKTWGVIKDLIVVE